MSTKEDWAHAFARQADADYRACLLRVIEQASLALGLDPLKMRNNFTHVKHLAQEIELLNPSATRDKKRPDNCEYPWEAGKVLSPLDHSFAPSSILLKPFGRTFRKLIRTAIDRSLQGL